MAGRTRAVLSGSAGDSLSECAAGDGYSYLPWVDCICAGVPCQDVSVAGKRAGLKGERTGLFYEFARILRELRPTWFVFENVPGLLSSNDGRDFAEVQCVLMVECGYGISWRVLDSQFFGVAQRRSRLFIVGYFGKPCPAEILFEPESVQGSASPRREKRSDIAVPLTRGSSVRSHAPGRRMEDDFNLAVCANSITTGSGRVGSRGCDDGANLVAATLNSGGNNGGFRTEPGEHIIVQDVRGGTRDKTNHGQGIGIRVGGPCYTLSATEQHGVLASALSASTGHHGHSSPLGDGSDNLVAATLPADHRFTTDSHVDNLQGIPIFKRRGGYGWSEANNISPTLESTGGSHQGGSEVTPLVLDDGSAPDANGVREFTGLPKGMDSPRYRALGNAVTTTVSEWIGRRIIEAEELNLLRGGV